MSSVMGTCSGSPYVAAVDENTRLSTPAARIASSNASELVTLPCQYSPGLGLADQGPGGEVHHAGERRVEDLAGEPGDVPLDERRARRYRVPVPGREVVDDDHLVSPLEQYGRAHAADVARASGDEQLHG